jgi:hypothetical protein
MIEELKQLLTMVEKVPETILWIAGGFGVYKLVLYLSSAGVIYKLGTLLITKVHDYKTRPEVLSLDDYVIDKTTAAELKRVIRKVTTRHDDYTTPASYVSYVLQSGMKYVHHSDISWLDELVSSKISEERDNRAKLKTRVVP